MSDTQVSNSTSHSSVHTPKITNSFFSMVLIALLKKLKKLLIQIMAKEHLQSKLISWMIGTISKLQAKKEPKEKEVEKERKEKARNEILQIKL